MKVKNLVVAAVVMLFITFSFGQNKKYKSIHDISVKDIKGNDVSLADHKDQRLVISAFPCNQFLEQGPGTSEEIQNFCSLTYNVTIKD